MTKHKRKPAQDRSVWIALFGLACLALLMAVLLRGNTIALFSPKGLIAQGEHNLILFTVSVLLVIGIPTLIILFSFVWEFRESNEKAAYEPNTRYSKLLPFCIWALPSMFMIILALVMWPAAHRLDPKKAIVADVKPLTIQVVALRWKWLFIYPEQNIATVNFVEIPAGTPVQFVLTADETPMSSFWIPQLGGQLYAMTGHANQLNLIADEPGDFDGKSAEINGVGFAAMTFTTRAVSDEAFDLWAHDIKSSSSKGLDSAGYASLLKPSENNAAEYYSSVDNNLYATIMMKYLGSHNHTEHE